MKKIFTIKLTIILGLSLFALVGMAQAEDKIDVEYPVGTNINGNDIFDYDNIYPGWEESKTIRVENDSEDEDVELYFTFDVNGDKKLAEKLKLYVIRVENGSYRIGGSGDRWTLEEADDERLYVDRLSATKGKEYRIKIKFDENAGNEYQGETAEFDIEFRIDSEEATAGQTETQILAGQGRVVSGLPPVEGAQEVTEVSEEGVAQTGAEEPLTVAGMEDICHSWPWWVWAIILAVFVGLFGYDAWRNYDEEEYGWKIALALAVAGVIFWWYFDKCREYKWFLYGVIIIAIAGHFIYLALLRRKVRKFDIDGKEAD